MLVDFISKVNNLFTRTGIKNHPQVVFIKRYNKLILV